MRSIVDVVLEVSLPARLLGFKKLKTPIVSGPCGGRALQKRLSQGLVWKAL